MGRKVTGEIQGIPIELFRFDEKSGEICIGDECLTLRLGGKESEIVIEYDPNSQKCNRETKKIVEKFLQQILGGKKPKIRVKKVSSEKS